MNKGPFLHYEKDYKSIFKSYYIALIPLLVFGFYKNGILLYHENLISFKDIFIPLYFYFFSIIIGIIISLITKESKSENILIALLITCTISLNTNMLIFPILLFVSIFICKYLYKLKKIPFNSLALSRIILVLALLLNSYSYLNILEHLGKYNYDLFDVFLGFNKGGIASTSTIIILFSLVFLAINKFYKKNIAFSASLSFILLGFIWGLINHNYFSFLLSGHVYFSFIFLAPDIYISPYTQKGQIIYGFLIGIITFIISLFLKYEAPYLAILLVSLFIPLLNKATVKNYLQK